MSKQGLKVILSLFLLFGVVNAERLKIFPFPENGSLTDIFNTNCLQMTQSQQMLKAYIMTGLNSNFDDPKGSLKRAIPLYGKRFQKIKSYFLTISEDKEAKEAFDKAETIWLESRRILEAKPTPEGALKLKDNFEKMISLLLKGSKPASKGGLELLSLTGKLCRAPMKITIDYLMRIWGVDVPNYEADVKKIIKEFHENLEQLKKNPLNDKDSFELLSRVERGFKFYEIMFNSKSSFIPSLLSRKADENFQMIRKIKAIYKSRLSNS
jgi:hypothetical protein